MNESILRNTTTSAPNDHKLAFSFRQQCWTSMLFALLLFGGGIKLGFSQSFVEGYIITNQGDMIQGAIKDDFEFAYTDSVFFRSSEVPELTAYFPDGLDAFFLGGKYQTLFVSKTVVENVAGKSQSKNRFLKQLVLGRANLYVQSTGPNRFHFYLENKSYEDRLILLEETKVTYEDENTGVEQNKKVKTYINALNVVLLDCPDAYAEISTTKFKKKHMADLIHQYNNCFSDERPSQLLVGNKGVVHHTGVLLSYNPIQNFFESAFSPLEYGLYHQMVFLGFSKRWFFEARLTHFASSAGEGQDRVNRQLFPLALLVYTRKSLGKTQWYLNGGPVVYTNFSSRYRQVAPNDYQLERRMDTSFPVLFVGGGVDFVLPNTHKIKCELGVVAYRPQVSLGYTF